MDGMRMPREEGCVMDEEIGVLHSCKIFIHSRKRIVAKREVKHTKIKERDSGVMFHIEGITCTEEEEKKKYC
jgi:hypothetical protein